MSFSGVPKAYGARSSVDTAAIIHCPNLNCVATMFCRPLHDDGTRLQCVSVAVNQQLVVAGDDTGRLVVHRYPVPTQQNGGIAIPGLLAPSAHIFDTISGYC